MGDAGYRGVSADQDGRFRNKEQALLKKLAASGQFPVHFDQRVNMKDVNVAVMRPWIAERVEELLGFEDDVVVEYVNGMLDDPNDRQPDPRKMQLSLTGFLEGSTATFMSELWTLLLSAQASIGGIPQQFVDKKKEEMRLARERDAAAIAGSGAVRGPVLGGRAEYDGRRQNFDAPASRQWRNDGHSREMRWQGQRETRRAPPNRRDFIDKSGVRTERVQDSGWGARATRSDSHSPRADETRVRANGHEDGTSRYGNSSRPYRDGTRARPAFERSRGRDDSRSPPPRRARKASSSRSLSPSSHHGRRRENGSVTPEWREEHRGWRTRSSSITPPRRSRKARSPSITPPRRLASRSPTYSPPQVSRRHITRPSLSLSPQPPKREPEIDSKKVKRSRWDRDD